MKYEEAEEEIITTWEKGSVGKRKMVRGIKGRDVSDVEKKDKKV